MSPTIEETPSMENVDGYPVILPTSSMMLVAALPILALILLAGCGDSPSAGCTSDEACKGARICVSGTCVDGEDPNNEPGPVDAGEPEAGELDAGEPDAGEPEGPADADAPTPDAVEGDDALDDAEVVGDAEEVDGGADAPEGEPEAVGDPEIEVSPSAIDFGSVGLRVSAFEVISVVNGGDGPLNVASVGLSFEAGRSFQIIPDRAVPFVLAPGQAAEVRVRFEPLELRGGRPTPQANAVVIRSDDPARPEVRIALEGVATPDPARCLTFSERLVDFGFVPPGEVAARQVVLQNCGREAIEVVSIELEGQTPALSVVSGRALPFSLAPGGEVGLALNFAPGEVVVVRGGLAARGEGVEAEVVLLGSPVCPVAGVDGRVGEGEPVVERLEAVVGDRVLLSAAPSVDPGRGALTYRWTLEAPEGSVDLRPSPASLDGQSLAVSPDVAGVYRVRLTVRSTVTGLESCEAAEILLDVSPRVSRAVVRLTWDNGADLDLHVVRGSGEVFEDFGDGRRAQEDDCYFFNPSPDWGQPGARFDDPRLLGDDTDGLGPEVTLLPILEADRRYRIGVNYARRLNTQTVEAIIAVEIESVVVQLFEATLEDQGTFWVPLVIEGDGTLTEVGEFIEP